jgi:hypothetical protein
MLTDRSLVDRPWRCGVSAVTLPGAWQVAQDWFALRRFRRRDFGCSLGVGTLLRGDPGETRV